MMQLMEQSAAPVDEAVVSPSVRAGAAHEAHSGRIPRLARGRFEGHRLGRACEEEARHLGGARAHAHTQRLACRRSAWGVVGDGVGGLVVGSTTSAGAAVGGNDGVARIALVGGPVGGASRPLTRNSRRRSEPLGGPARAGRLRRGEARR
jgi:hypothetical protein